MDEAIYNHRRNQCVATTDGVSALMTPVSFSTNGLYYYVENKGY